MTPSLVTTKDPIFHGDYRHSHRSHFGVHKEREILRPSNIRMSWLAAVETMPNPLSFSISEAQENSGPLLSSVHPAMPQLHLEAMDQWVPNAASEPNPFPWWADYPFAPLPSSRQPTAEPPYELEAEEEEFEWLNVADDLEDFDSWSDWPDDISVGTPPSPSPNTDSPASPTPSSSSPPLSPPLLPPLNSHPLPR